MVPLWIWETHCILAGELRGLHPAGASSGAGKREYRSLHVSLATVKKHQPLSTASRRRTEAQASRSMQLSQCTHPKQSRPLAAKPPHGLSRLLPPPSGSLLRGWTGECVGVTRVHTPTGQCATHSRHLPSRTAVGGSSHPAYSDDCT